MPKKFDFFKAEAGKEEPESRQNQWAIVINTIENTADKEGYRIDEGIKDAVIALNALQINTGQSCEGHVERGISAPWIRIEAPNEPEERFIGQNKAFEEVAQKYKMPLDQAKRMFNLDAYWEAIHKICRRAILKSIMVVGIIAISAISP